MLKFNFVTGFWASNEELLLCLSNVDLANAAFDLK